MQIIHSDSTTETLGEIHGHAIFLAGPTPRSINVPSWRPRAIEILGTLGYRGTVLVPERYDWETKFDYQDQTEWEYAALTKADVIGIWVPRTLDTMPGFTTNVEFGFWLARCPKKVVYGRPDDAPKNRYLDWLYQKEKGDTPHSTLASLLYECVEGKMVGT